MAPGLDVRTAALEQPPELLPLLPPRLPVAWVRRGEGFVGWGEAARLEAGFGAERFQRATALLAELAAEADVADEVRGPGSGLVAFGSFTFDDHAHGSVMVVPSVVVARRGGRGWTTRVGTGGPLPSADLPAPTPVPAAHPDRVRYAGSSQPDREWLEAVAAAVQRIEAGELDKVVLARDHAVWSKLPFDPRVLLRRLAARFPSCFTFFCERLVGATPELLVRRVGHRVDSLVLAGSAPRGADADDDDRLGAGLLESKKDRTEHDLAVASVRDVLAPLCPRLRVDREPRLLRLDNVQHLATRVRGTLEPDHTPTALELAGALHPTAAVGGAPTEAALGVIRALERLDRGRYGGPVGWVDAAGDGEWAIALRCAELMGARARLFAGAGIVDGSLPEAELEETRLKLAAMQSAFGE